MQEIDLPPMPEPTGKRLGTRGVFGIGMVPCEVDSNEFTADQLRSYATQAVLQDREKRARLVSEMDCAHRCGVGSEIAAAIRGRTKE